MFQVPYRALRQVLKSVPAGGTVLCWDESNYSDWLQRHRGDQVTCIRKAEDCWSVESGSHLACCSLQSWNIEENAGKNALSELSRVANRFLILGSYHPFSLGSKPPETTVVRRHRQLEDLVQAHGFRLMSRAAARLFLDPLWIYSFVRR